MSQSVVDDQKEKWQRELEDIEISKVRKFAG